MNCVYAKEIYTGRGVVKDAYVAFDGTKIAGVSKSPRGKVLGRFAAATPAFIDAHCHIGLARAGEPSQEAEVNERLEMISAVPDALDSVMMDDPSFKESIEAGVLYSCVVPGSAQIIGGRSAFIRNFARNTTEALVSRAGIKGAMGYNPTSDKTKPGQRPLTRMGSLSLLRSRLHDVRLKIEKHRRARGRKKDDVAFSAEESVLRDVLTRKEFLRMHVHKIDDIAALLRLADEFKLRLVVEHTCDVHDRHIYDELKRRHIPVVFGPLDSFAYKVELKHENWRNVRLLVESGVEYGFMTDHPVSPARTLLLQMRWFARAGVSKRDAIEVISRKNAELVGIDNVLGTLDRGKWASFACWNGDPFDMTAYPVRVYGEGAVLFED